MGAVDKEKWCKKYWGEKKVDSCVVHKNKTYILELFFTKVIFHWTDPMCDHIVSFTVKKIKK